MSNRSHSLVSSLALGVAVALACIGVARRGEAQFTSAIDLASRATQPTSNPWQSQIAIAPFMRFDHPRIALDGRWTVTGGDGRRMNGFGNLGATYYAPTFAGVQFSLAGFVDRTRLSETFAVSRIGIDPRLSVRFGSTGAWLGREMARDNKPTPVSPNPHYLAGVWRQLGGAVLTLSLSSFGAIEGARGPVMRVDTVRVQSGPLGPDTLARTKTVVDSGSPGRRHDWRDAELGLHWGVGRLAMQAIVGTRFSATNQPNEYWGEAHGSYSFANDIAIIASTGVRPSSGAYSIARSRFVEFGVRVAPSALLRPRLPSGVRPTAAAFQVDDASNGKRTLRIRVPDARSVELSADFTSWKPIALKHGDADQWEATLPIAAGMHRVAIRIDGDAWTTPPGVATEHDEFQGTVGVIVVK